MRKRTSLYYGGKEMVGYHVCLKCVEFQLRTHLAIDFDGAKYTEFHLYHY